jgi:hypothetical protein
MSENATRVLSSQQWCTVAEESVDPTEPDDLLLGIVEAVGEAENRDPAEIESPPLSAVIDVGGVERALFDTGGLTDSPVTADVRFLYRGWRITVNSDGSIFVAEST